MALKARRRFPALLPALLAVLICGTARADYVFVFTDPALAPAIFLKKFVVQAFRIPSIAMSPTLVPDDHILIDKIGYPWREPSRGDVVVFTFPDNPKTPEIESTINIIKRIIGLPGETVEVRGTKVFINGEALDEPYAVWEENGKYGGYRSTKVPEGRVFMLGDNRDHSKDSRFWDDPFPPLSRIKGRAFIIYWSTRIPSRSGTPVR